MKTYKVGNVHCVLDALTKEEQRRKKRACDKSRWMLKNGEVAEGANGESTSNVEPQYGHADVAKHHRRTKQRACC